MGTSISARVRAFSILLAGLVGLSSVAWGAGAAFAAPGDSVFVCKFSAQGDGEKLQAFNEVNVSAIKDFPTDPAEVSFPYPFADAQSNSVALGFVGGEVFDASDCVPMPPLPDETTSPGGESACDVLNPATGAALGAGDATWTEVLQDTWQFNFKTFVWDPVIDTEPEFRNVQFTPWSVQKQVDEGCVAKDIEPPTPDRTVPQAPTDGCAVTHPGTGAVLGSGVVTHDLVFDGDTAVYDAVTNTWSIVEDITGEVANVDFDEWSLQQKVENGCVEKATAPTITPELVEQTPLSGCEVQDPATDEVLGAGVVTYDLRFLDTAVYDAVTNTWSVENDTEGDVVNVDFTEWTAQERVDNGCEAKPAPPTITPELVEQTPLSGCEVHDPATDEVLGAGVVTYDLRFLDTAVYDPATNTWSVENDTEGDVLNVDFTEWTLQQQVENDCVAEAAEPTYGPELVEQAPVFGCEVVDPLTGAELGAGVVTHDLRYQDTAVYDAVTNTWSRVDDASGEIANVEFTAWTAAEREANDCPDGVIVDNPVDPPKDPNGEEPNGPKDPEQPETEVPSGGAVNEPEVSAPGGQSPVVPTSVDAGLGDLAATDQTGHAAYLLPAGLAAALLLLLAGLGLIRGGRHA